MSKRDVNTHNTYQLRITLLAITVELACLSLLCGCTQQAKSPANTAKSSSKLVDVSSEIYSTWDATQQGSLLALPVDVDSKSGAKDRLLVVDLQGKSYRIRKVIDGGLFTSWSPKGDQLAFSQEVDKEVSPGFSGSSIGLYSPEMDLLVSFPNGYVDKDPVWRQDGSAIAFARIKFGDFLKGQLPACRLMIVPVRGGVFDATKAESYQVAGHTSEGHTAEALQWRPLSKQVTYVGLGRIGYEGDNLVRSHDVYLIDAGTGNKRKLTHSGDVERYSIGWSPDGRYIAFATGLITFKTLEILDTKTNKRTIILRASSLLPRKLQNIANIIWSPNGKWIVFDASRNQPGAHANIGIIEWPSLKFRWLTKDSSSKAPRWSSDGRILFIRKGTEVWQMTPKGSDLKKLYALCSAKK
ncbi:MAG: TolB family protein [Armatimonadota bacterium]